MPIGMQSRESRESRVDCIPGVGKKRSTIFSGLGIQTVGQFLDRTAADDDISKLCLEADLSEKMVRRLRNRALGIVPVDNGQPLKRLDVRLGLALVLMCISVLLILGGTITAASLYKESRFFSPRIIILHNDTVVEPHFSWRIDGKSSLKKSGVTRTRITIKPGWRTHFSQGYPGNIPDSLFISVQSWCGMSLKSAEAKLWIVDTGSEQVEGPWEKSVDIRRTEAPIPAVIKDVRNLDNRPGRNYFVHLRRDAIPEKLLRGQEVDFMIEMYFEDAGFEKPLNRYKRGFISVRSSLSVSESAFLGFDEERFGDLKLPGSKFIKFGSHSDCETDISYFWSSELSGEFLKPDSLIAAEQFAETGTNQVEGDFVYKTTGSLWLSYIAAIIGLPIFMGGLALARRRRSPGN